MTVDEIVQPDPQDSSLAAKIGRWLGPVLAILCFLGLSGIEDVPPEAPAAASVILLIGIWWMTEAIPLGATSLLPLVLFPLLGVHQEASNSIELGQEVIVYAENSDEEHLSSATVIELTAESATVLDASQPEPNEGSVGPPFEVELARLEPVSRKHSPFEFAARPYANQYVFLMMGGFLLALSIEKWGLHRRIALHTIRLIGTNPSRLILGFMIATAALSMFITNTASTLVMLPIAISVATVLSNRGNDPGMMKNFGTCLLLGVAYSASIGGLATFVGTPTNLLIVETLSQEGYEISFAQWMMFGLPLSIIFLLVSWVIMTRFLFRLNGLQIEGSRDLIDQLINDLGKMNKAEWRVLLVFLLTAVLWIFRVPITNWEWLVDQIPAIARLNDTIIALSAGLVLFLIPSGTGQSLLNWQTAVKLPWQALLLFGGGLSLAAAVSSTGLDQLIGSATQELFSGGIPIWILIIAVTTVVIFLTEFTSNTATAALFMPILLATITGVESSTGVDIDAMLVIIPAGLAASCAFMLPVATPPNIIVFGSGRVTIRQMVKAGFTLNLVAIVLVPLLTYFIGRWAMQ